jgi:hypothetical protein
VQHAHATPAESRNTWPLLPCLRRVVVVDVEVVVVVVVVGQAA